ncbi:hypothetical protein GCM10028794_00900 [Silanimonas algicola]
MIRRRTLGIGAALAFLGSAALLVSGHPLLNWPSTGLPLGTVIAGVLVVSLGALPLAIAAPGRRAELVAKATLALAVSWLPLCLLLAGNLRLNFASGWRGDTAAWLSVAVLAAIGVAGLVTIGSTLAARRTRGAPDQSCDAGRGRDRR